MTKLSANLTTLQWSFSKDRLIKGHGLDPADRIHYTGHVRPISSSYIRTVGHWGLLSVREMCNPDNPVTALAHVTIGAFRQFRWHHGLMTRSEFEAHYGTHRNRPWLIGYVCWEAHDRAQRKLVAANGVPASIGEAAALAVRDSETGASLRLGLLPVEVVLYARHFDRFVRHLPVLGLITYDEWCGVSDDDKSAYWNLGEGDASTPWGDISSPGPHLIASREPASFRSIETGDVHGPGCATAAAG